MAFEHLTGLRRTAHTEADPQMGEAIALEAVVVEDVESVGDDVVVTIEGDDGGRNKFECIQGVTRVDDAGELALPTVGDRALVLVSDDREYWIVAWTPT